MALKARMKSKFPARVVAGTGLTITRSGATYTFGFDWSGLAALSSIAAADRDVIFVPTYNSATGVYGQAAVEILNDTPAIKTPCRAATTVSGGNITLSGAQTIDDIAVVAGDRVLVKNQTTGSENGIYVAAAGAWSRAADFDGSGDITSGTLIYVTNGTENGDKLFQVATDDPITLGSTSLTISVYVATTKSALGLETSSTDNEIVRFDGVDGNTQASGITIDDSKGIAPITNGTGTVGTAANRFAGVNLAQGAAIDWPGTITLTHSTGTLAVGGNFSVSGTATVTGSMTVHGVLTPGGAGSATLGTGSVPWGTVHIASGFGINIGNGDIVIGSASNLLTFSGAATGYLFDAPVAPSSSGAGTLGSTARQWATTYLQQGVGLDWNAGSATITYSTGTMAHAGATTYSFAGAISATTVAGSMVATATIMEAATSTQTVVVPGHQHRHPLHLKALCKLTLAGATATLQLATNVSGAVRNSTGNVTVSFTTPFSTTSYAVGGYCGSPGAFAGIFLVTARSLSSCTIQMYNDFGSSNYDHTDANFFFGGDQ
jgi:hypothetical protein